MGWIIIIFTMIIIEKKNKENKMLLVLKKLLDFLVQNKDTEVADFSGMLDFEEELKKEQEEDKAKIKESYLKILEDINQLLILNQNNILVTKNLQTYVEILKNPFFEYSEKYDPEMHGMVEDIAKSSATLEKDL